MPEVDLAFTLALPKIELHAHLTGSIDVQCLHQIWSRKRTTNTGYELTDPLKTIRPEGMHHNIFNFFTLFDQYIYALCNDADSVRYCTLSVLSSFENDGVCYLELRTTPRESLSTGMTKDVYIASVLDAIEEHGQKNMTTYLILSIDRRNKLEQAMHVVDLAIKYRNRGVVGVDLCGNPLKGDVRIFKEAFARAKANGLKITLHFAEMPQSSTEEELWTLLSYEPDRIGHVVNTPPDIIAEIARRQIGLELCLSCNVHAKMIQGGFADHHFGSWYQTACPLALSTDDVGVFDSPLSNEYLLAAQHFHLDRNALVQLVRRAVPSIFGGTEAQHEILDSLDKFGINQGLES